MNRLVIFSCVFIVCIFVSVGVTGCISTETNNEPLPPGLQTQNETLQLTQKDASLINTPISNTITLQWDYTNTTGSPINDISNILFVIDYSLDLSNWMVAGTTTNTYFIRVTDSQQEFYRVSSVNSKTGYSY